VCSEVSLPWKTDIFQYSQSDGNAALGIYYVIHTVVLPLPGEFQLTFTYMHPAHPASSMADDHQW
jgi:hypothetical protein